MTRNLGSHPLLFHSFFDFSVITSLETSLTTLRYSTLGDRVVDLSYDGR